MKRILYLSFYFEPDLCAGSFRNSPLAKELAKQCGDSVEIIIITTNPNRYNTFKVDAPLYEHIGNLTIHRISIPEHHSGFTDQIYSFLAFYKGVQKIVKQYHFDMVFASSSRLFTAFLGYRISKIRNIPLYLDIRDIFTDTMKDVLSNRLLKTFAIPILEYIEFKTFSKADHINLISAGFKTYFTKYPKPNYSYFSNGIDDEFLNLNENVYVENNPKKIIYAGNIGEGQGLHIIIPEAAKALEGKFEFLIVGDGGAKARLLSEVNRLKLTNIQIIDPVKRSELLQFYDECDFFFIHLNDYEAFKKVLPSKVFELAAYDKPIIAGVSGYARSFIEENIVNSIVFNPGDVLTFVKSITGYMYRRERRTEFLNKYLRSKLNRDMASSILSYLP